MKDRQSGDAKPVSKPGFDDYDRRTNPYFIIILILTLIVPVIILPKVLDNAFNTPKTLTMLLLVSLIICIYTFSYFQGKEVYRSESNTKYFVLFLIILNFFSLLYTKNLYYTRIAVILNITCLALFHFVALYIDNKKALFIIYFSAASGFIVSIVVWLQLFDIYLLMPWMEADGMITGTIGNSNYLGAYLIFPLYSVFGLIFIFKGKYRIILIFFFLFVLGAFVFARARSSWVGFLVSLPLFLYVFRRITRSPWLKLSRLTICFLGVAILASLIWLVTPDEIKERRVGLTKVFDIQTIKYRFTGYLPPSIELWKQSPLFGTGLWSYRSMVYEAQARINSRTGHFFDDYSEPRPRRAHNDYLEILNDGGLVAATCLLTFFIIIMIHGWNIIKDDYEDVRTRVIIATSFCSIISIMITAIFFFPFRLNSTMFMTVLMMGLIEGIYLRRKNKISIHKGLSLKAESIMIVIILFILAGNVWYSGIRPLKAEIEYLKYKRSLSRRDREMAENHLLRAIRYDPGNSAYLLYASQFYLNFFKDFQKASDYAEKAIDNFNGDITMWSAYYIKGLIRFRVGNILEAKTAFEKSLYYFPFFKPAQEKLLEVNKVIEEHDGVTIKFK